MKKRHLSVLGVGPIYVFTIVIVTIVGVILSIKGVIPKDECNNLILRIYYIFLGFISTKLWNKILLTDSFGLIYKQSK